MAHEKAIAAAFDGLWGKSSERNLIRGRLGLPGGGTPVFDVPDRPGYKYVNKGAAGEQGQVLARDPIGVANTYNQSVWMRYEFGEYVIQRADAVAGGGGGGGASNLDALTDVTLTTPANGNTLSYNSATGQWVNVVPAGGASGAPSPHAHSSVHHTGLLPWTELNKSGSSLGDLATRAHSMLTGIGPNDHHAQAHVLATGTALGADHTISGAAAGEVLRAIDATHAAFDQLQHTDLGSVLPDQHHARAHDIITGDVSGAVHTIVGAQFQVVGATAVNTLGLLTPTPAPGAAAAILRTDANGGIQLDTNLFYVDGANNRIGVNVAPGIGPKTGAAALDIRAATTGDITQRIRQLAGQTQRLWRIEDVNGDELIVLDNVGNLQSGYSTVSGGPGFVSGLLGWQITPTGDAEFNNIWARGELHATVFVKDEVHASGGSLLVASAGVLHDDAVIDSTTVDDDVLVVYSTAAGVGAGVPLQVVTTAGGFSGNELHVVWIRNTINVNDPPSGPGFYFQPGDIIRSKTEVATGVTDFWLEVNSAVQNSGYSTYSVFKRSGTDGKLPKGSAVVSYGKAGDGRIMMTSDLNYAPYIDIFSIGPAVWTASAGSIIPHVRLGRLDGVGLPGSHIAPGGVYSPGAGLPGITGDGSTPQYGMIAGSDLSNANSGYLIASNQQFSLYRINIRLNDGSNDTGLWTADGTLKIGKNVGLPATTGLQFDAVTGNVVIGNEATGNYLRWQQATGILQVAGSLVVTDPGTTVTKTYVDTQDASYDAKADLSATGYAGIAQKSAQDYAEARRVTGVTGTWACGNNLISWTGPGSVITLTLANGGNRSIAAGNTGTISVRTYLYVNISLAGTLTMIPLASPAVSQPNYVLVAVCDPGSPKASVTVVAGTTFISGGNIATQSIQAGNIASRTITANEIFGGTITAFELNSSVIVSINNADVKGQAGIDAAADAQLTADNSNKYKLQAVRGSMVVQALPGGRNGISWGNPDTLVLYYANGITFSLPDGSLSGLSTSARTYIHYNYGTAILVATTNLAGLATTSALIAVFDPGATASDPGSLSIVGGATYISGNNIVTGSVFAANIQSGAVKANKIDVDGNIDIAGAGRLTLGSGGNIQTLGKTSYGDTTPGVFLGYDPSGVAGYKFGIGDGSNYITWGGTGTALSIRTTGGVDLFAVNDASTVLRFLSGNGNISLRHTHDDPIRLSRIKSDGVWAFDFELYAEKLINTGSTPRILTQRHPAPNAIGSPGEWCWFYDLGINELALYMCYQTNSWRKLIFTTSSWTGGSNPG